MSVPVRLFPRLLFAAALLLAAHNSKAQTSVATNPVGYVQLTCTAASDTTVAVPFTQPAAFVGTIAAISGSTVTVNGTASWTANQYVYSGSGSSTYYAQMGPYSSGTDPMDGSYFTVVSNGTNTLTLSLNGGSLSAVPAGSTITIYPYWTLATVFPPNESGTDFIASTSPLSHQTQVLIPNYTGTGANLSPTETYFFYNSAWRLVGDSISNSHNDDVLIPDGYVIVRNPSATTTLTTMGNVLTGNLTIPLATEASIAQDNFVSICRPIDTTLNNLDLISAGAFTVSTSPLAHQDLLLLTSNTNVGFNKSPTSTYFYYVGTSGTGWRLVGDSISNDHGNDVVPAGTGCIIRKVATNNGNTVFWQNSPSY
ncbi:MAG TPA: TIGR02597 family protein [Chthoniobacteraceae bacterium]|jgi:uncharacterized protein (TIGR02597 family)|nr:TIGR02597 family protein [Chthoniobacteraceae bacterium]